MDINIKKLADKYNFNIYLREGVLIHKEESIAELPKDSIFVFGSNTAGRHGAGAAKYARVQFGAVYGQGEGLQGQSYALPTLGDNLEQLRDIELYKHFKEFIKFAINNVQYTFILTKVGCGLAGYPYAEDMYMCFLEDIEHELDLPKLPMNIIFPADFTNNLNYPPEF